jgi:hypothetical protein
MKTAGQVVSVICASLLLLARGIAESPGPKSVTVDDTQEDARVKVLDREHNYKQLKGIAFHFCSCDVPCPCMFAGEEPDSCRIIRVLHITEGGNVGKAAEGATLVIIPVRKQQNGEKENGEEAEAARKPDRIVYISDKLTEEQQRELRAQFDDLDIWLFGWANSEFRPAKISFIQTEEGGYDVEIPGVFRATAEPVVGEGKKPITAHNLPLSEGTDWYIGKSKVHRYKDPKEPHLEWDLAGKNGSWTFFETHYVER